MQKHDRCRELSALAAVGQLSMEEYRELSEHLQACESCKRAGDQYAFILDQLPLPEPSADAADLQQLQSASYRQRFFRRASSEGLHFTQEALGKRKSGIQVSFARNWRPFALGAASAAAILLFSATILAPSFVSRSTRAEVASAAPVANSAPRGTPAVSTATVQADPGADTIARLEQANLRAEERLNALRQELAHARAEKQKLLADLERWKGDGGRLQAENQQNKQQLGQAKNELEKLGNDKDQLTASLVAQQVRIQELSEEVQAQMAAVEREKQLTAAARDVRELMGARNLHIIDVADLDGRGKSKRSFGRVFYIEGKSLIFYAFDLSQKGSASKVSFQAWGQTPGGGSSVKNLGVFRIDDQVQKRWVLRVDKPELLASIESVYVTVEPAPGRDRPSGQKLLYAYLGTQANHP
jgi:hypothetical protein